MWQKRMTTLTSNEAAEVEPLMSLRRVALFGAVMAGLASGGSVFSQQSPAPKPRVLFTNVNVFDGVNEKRIENANVLVEGNLIKQVSASAISAEGATVIDGGGRTLMPGLTDAHWHVLYAGLNSLDELRTDELDYIHARMIAEAGKTLMRGFTTVRDVGGGGYGLKRALDEGIFPGPRILPSGTHIGITGGHADYTESWHAPRRFGGTMDRFEQIESFRKVAGVPEMLDAVRFNLKRGASQIKILMGGGVASTYDPLDVNEFTFEEVKAAVDVATNWGTYVTVHIYTSDGIKKAIKAGVKGIEHGHLMDEEAAKLMATNGVWLGIQPFSPDHPGAEEALGPEKFKKYLEMANGFPKTMDFVKKYNIKLSFGTDLSFTPDANGAQANALASFSKWFTNYELLKLITSQNAEYFALSGERHPYKQGPLGVIKEGAYADIILVDGNPLDGISILGDDGKNIPLIMKDGRIYKNTLQ